jgi:hypothetical protein
MMRFWLRFLRCAPDRPGIPGLRRSFGILGTLALAVVLAAIRAPAAHAQEIRSAISPDSVLVGDVFHAAIRVNVPPGLTLSAPDSLPVTGEIENAGRMRRSTRELPGGGSEVTLVYPLSAWRTGQLELPQVTLTLTGPDGAREAIAAFPNPLVRSVLPGDTTGLRPRPPKDVLGPSRLLWPWVLGALTLVAAVTGFVYYGRRRRQRVPALSFDVAHADSPRERALAALDRVRSRGLVEAGQFKAFYIGTTAALRAFLEEYDTAWGTELTSVEVLQACRNAISGADADRLAELLDAADHVKFNRRTPTPAEAFGEWEAVRQWVDHFQIRGPGPAVSTEDAP